MQNLSINSNWLFPTFICAHCKRVLQLERNIYMREDKKYCSQGCRREVIKNNSPPYEDAKVN